MSLLRNKLPEIKAEAKLSSAQFDLRQDALAKWEPNIRASTETAASISMLAPIGQTYDGNGVTAARVAGALRAIGEKDVVVNLNSPGGDFFEGVAIYNLLRNHPAKVTVNIMGLAASAASVIAMAGDEINIGQGAFLMIHNAWVLAAGNRNDLRDAADYLEPFDQAMADLYSARTGLSVAKVSTMMDNETYIGAKQAVKDGFANAIMEPGGTTVDTKAQGNTRVMALVESALAKAGYSRAERRDTFKELFTDKPGAVDEPVMPSADVAASAASIQSIIDTLKGI